MANVPRCGFLGIVAFGFSLSPALAQQGALPVTIQGRILDLAHVPPNKPVNLTESVDAGSGAGPQVVFDLDPGNLVLFTTSSNSTLFNLYTVPGAAADLGSVHIPWNRFYFYSSVNSNGDGTGFIAGTMFYNCGLLSMDNGTASTTNVYYAGDWDSPLWVDRSIDPNPIDMVAPLYYWADLVSGDPNACAPLAASQTPPGRFVILTRRFGCDAAIRWKNIEASGAIGWIVYDDQDSADLLMFSSPHASIPIVHIRAKDGAAIIDQLHASGAPVNVTLHPTNVQGSIMGTYQMDGEGNLINVNLNLVVGNAYDSIFAGTVSAVRQ